MSSRALLLPNRRVADVRSFTHEGRQWTATFGFFANGQLAEVFLDTKPSPLADMAQDAAILASLCFQHGVDLDVVRHAIAGRGGPLAAALALIKGGAE
jgi:hypothetical protein